MNVQKVEFTDANFTTETREGLCVVCFGDPWDAECVKEHVLVEKAAEAINGQIKLGSCQIENCPALAERFQVTTIPTLLILKDGWEVERLTGFRHTKALIKHLRKHAVPIF